jgi:hypothetical protein
MVAGKSVSFTSTEDDQPRAEGSITQGRGMLLRQDGPSRVVAI